MTDEELKKLEGKPYTKDNARKLIYGGRINSKGIIVEVITKKKHKKRCRSTFSFF
ncbi:MAG: hypothetical protein R6V50_00600 [Thermoplasmatota archaeon]